MKIAVVGCGAVGSYYGGKLASAGHETHFLLRSDYDVVCREGVRVSSPDGDSHFQPHCARRPGEIGPADLVIIALKTTANAEFSRLLPPLVGEHTVILTLQNGLGNEEALARLFRTEQILGGLCFVCLNRLRPGVIVHLDHGRIVIGEFQGVPRSRTEAIASAFREAGVNCTISDDLARAHWEKLVWNIPFNGLGVAAAAGYEALMSGTMTSNQAVGPVWPTDRLLADPKWVQLLRELMLEVVAAARARGHPLEPHMADEQLQLTRSMGPYKASTLLDFENGKPLELQSLFLEPLRQAVAAGALVPRIASLCGILQALHDRMSAG